MTKSRLVMMIIITSILITGIITACGGGNGGGGGGYDNGYNSGGGNNGGNGNNGGTLVNIFVDGVTLAPATLNLTVGGSTGTLTATVTPKNATNKTITWSSNNTNVATVNNGTVIAVSQGTANITVTTLDGNKTATCTVNVSAAGTTTAVAFSSVTGNGSTTQTTTQLTLTFSQAITGLTADNITLSGISGLNKGILSGSGTTYTLPISGFTTGGTLSVAVASPSGYDVSGSPKTVTIYSVVQPGTAEFTLTFAQMTDISVTPISGPTIYRTGTPTSVTITLDNSGQYTNITWRITGTSITGTGSTFTLTTVGNPIYNSLGQHFLTVEVMKAGIPYNKTIVFTVAQ